MKEGLGDKVEKITKATGIKKIFDKTGKDCGCENRKQKLNNLTLQRQKPSGCLTEELFKAWGDFRKRSPKEINKKDQQLICDIVREVWAMSFSPCSNCQSVVWQSRIDKIDAVYLSYEEKSKKSKTGTSTARGRKRGQQKKTDGVNKESGKPSTVRNGNATADTPKSRGATGAK